MITEDEFIGKYGNIEVRFLSYYKYEFTFTGQHEGKEVYVRVGGDKDSIYRFSVDAESAYKVSSLGISRGIVKEGDTVLDEYKDSLW